MTESMSAEVKYCFVLMPIADTAGYEAGHFGRVYEHLFKPAILAAGYIPIRADDTVKTDYIVVGIIQKIVDSAMVLCDFSSRNANVMYELGVRHAFNKPVVLVKDQLTEKIFDIQGLRYTEYDQSLRVDSVGKDIQKITQAIKETAAGGAEALNSIVQLAGIRTAEVPKGQTISSETKLILNAIESFQLRIGRIEEVMEPRSSKFSLGSTGSTSKYFKLSNGDEVRHGETLYRNGRAIGILWGFNENGDAFIVKPPDGTPYMLSLNSKEGKTVSTIPF